MSPDDLDNVLINLADEQDFCGNESRTIIDPKSNKQLMAYEVLLKDSKEQYCKGYISEALVNESLDANQNNFFFQEVELNCSEEPFAIPMDSKCPELNLWNTDEISHFSQSHTVYSPEFGFARVRANIGGYNSENIFIELKDGQNLCGYGLVQIIDPVYGMKGPDAYQILLQDPDGQYCKGYIHASLIEGGYPIYI